MEDIGDLCDLQVSADNPALSVASKRLQRLKIGDEDASKVTTNVQALNFGECPSMMIVDARNAKSLTGSIDLSKMPRLLEAYFGGTAVKSVNVPNGSKIVVLELGEETTQISLMNLKFMDGEGFQYTSLPKLEFIRIENCSQLSPFQLLKGIYNTEGNVIRDIRVIGFDVEGDASDFAMIANMANDVDKDGNPHIYNGIDAEGKPMDNSHPVIEGKLSVAGNVYEDDYNAIKEVFPNLDMSFLGFYFAIKDPEVLRILLEKISSDGIGITKEEAESVTSLNGWFYNNTLIETFDELERFTGLTNLTYGSTGVFANCTSLKSVKIPASVTELGYKAFGGCSALESIGSTEHVKILTASVFNGCSSLAIDVNFPNLETIVSMNVFASSGIKNIVSLGKIKSIPDGNAHNNGVFAYCKSLETATFPELLQSTGNYMCDGDTALTKVVFLGPTNTIAYGSFYGCNALSELTLDWSKVIALRNNAFYNCSSLEIEDLALPNLETLGDYAFHGVKIKKISDLGKITAAPTSNTNAGAYGDRGVLKEIVFPDTLTSIPAYSLYNYNALNAIVFKPIAPPTLVNSNAFNNTNSCPIYVPDASVDAYKAATNWSSFADRIKPLSEYTE